MKKNSIEELLAEINSTEITEPECRSKQDLIAEGYDFSFGYKVPEDLKKLRILRSKKIDVATNLIRNGKEKGEMPTEKEISTLATIKLEIELLEEIFWKMLLLCDINEFFLKAASLCYDSEWTIGILTEEEVAKRRESGEDWEDDLSLVLSSFFDKLCVGFHISDSPKGLDDLMRRPEGCGPAQ